VNEYGITENRFFVIALGVWLAAIVIYFLFSRSASIKIIPASLCVLVFLGSFGPWGAFRVSEESQLGRLEAILTNAGILRQGKIVRSSQPVPFDQAQEISSIVRYIHNVHGVASLQPWFDIALDTLGTGKNEAAGIHDRDMQPRAMATLMGVEYVQAWQARNESGFHRFQRKKEPVYSVQGYDHFLRSIVLGQKEPAGKSFSVGPDTMQLVLSPRTVVLTSWSPGTPGDSVTMELAPLVRRLLKESNNPYETPGELMLCTGQGRRLDVKVFLQSIVASAEGDSIRVQRVDMDVLVGRRDTVHDRR
jgi:hypothetical protein